MHPSDDKLVKLKGMIADPESMRGVTSSNHKCEECILSNKQDSHLIRIRTRNILLVLYK